MSNVFNDPFFAESWNNTEAAAGRTEIPDGKHFIIFGDNRVETNEKGTTLIFDLYYPQFNRNELDYNSVTEAGIPYLKRKLESLGISTDKLVAIPDLIKTLKGKKAEVTRKTNGKYRNYFYTLDKGDGVPF